MAIGLSNVETRKVKKSAPKSQDNEREKSSQKPPQKSRMASILIEDSAKALDAVSAAPKMPRESGSRLQSSGELNSLWLAWSTQVAGAEKESLVLSLARQWMELEKLVFDVVKESVLKELHRTAFGIKIKERVQGTRS